MFDRPVRPWIDPPLDALARRLASVGATADGVTIAGLSIGLVGALAVAAGAPLLGISLFAINRIADGLDGALARRSDPTDRGGFLDIIADFWVYAAYPLAFAVVDPAANALAAATLLASFLVSGTAFLAFAVMAAKRGLTTEAQGKKSIYYLAGLAEGFETIVAIGAMGIWPAAFAPIAFGFALICTLSAIARVVIAARRLG